MRARKGTGSAGKSPRTTEPAEPPELWGDALPGPPLDGVAGLLLVRAPRGGDKGADAGAGDERLDLWVGALPLLGEKDAPDVLWRGAAGDSGAVGGSRGRCAHDELDELDGDTTGVEKLRQLSPQTTPMHATHTATKGKGKMMRRQCDSA